MNGKASFKLGHRVALFTYILLYLGLITLIWAYLHINCPDFNICAIFTLYGGGGDTAS